MSTTYAVGMRLGGGGGGDRAYHAVRALYGAGYVQRLYVSSSATNEFGRAVHSMGLAGRALRYLVYHSHSDRANQFHDVMFDQWVAAQLRPCALFHGSTLHALASLQRARALGATTLLDRGMAHPMDYADMLDEEYARWGLDRRFDRGRVRRELLELERADLLLMGSAFSAQTYLDRGYAAEGMITIPYGVDNARFCPAECASERPFRVLFVGQVSLGKGIAYLLQAWKALAWRDAELWLAGNVAPELRPALDGLLAQPGVRVLGYMPRPEEAYRAVDLFCLPSLSEGSALVTYEAMACGLPLVITPEAGAMATHEREALLCPARDVSALAEALQCLRDDSALRLRMGQAARRLMQDYSWERYGEQLVALYGRLLAA